MGWHAARAGRRAPRLCDTLDQRATDIVCPARSFQDITGQRTEQGGASALALHRAAHQRHDRDLGRGRTSAPGSSRSDEHGASGSMRSAGQTALRA